MKLIHRGLYFTSDNWKTAKAGLGEYVYYDPYTEETKTGYGLIAETIVGSIMLSNLSVFIIKIKLSKLIQGVL